MKKVLVISALMLAVLLMSTTSSATAADATITLLNNLPTELAVGESYTIDILIESDEPFILAIALSDAYYPGRWVFFSDSDRAHHAGSAVLHLTVTGKKSTADLPAVCDWPEPGAPCSPEGTAPLGIGLGVRYKGGVVVTERFNFAVSVP